MQAICLNMQVKGSTMEGDNDSLKSLNEVSN